MVVLGVVEQVDEERVVVLLGEEGYEVSWPRCFLPEVEQNDLLRFDIREEVPASEVNKMSPKALLDRLAWRP